MFFFSSRRRHTRWPRDWSSDVCSSDLADACVIEDLVVVLGFGIAVVDLEVRLTALDKLREIGRASCRERVSISVVAVILYEISVAAATAAPRRCSRHDPLHRTRPPPPL